MCRDSAMFVYDDMHDKQIFGIAMGSPVSAVVLNLVKEELERKIFAVSNDWSPRHWFRYVDDTFAIVHRDKVEHLEKLGDVYPSIKFIKEVEDRRLALLDVEVHRQHDGSLETSVYRKPTHTNKLLDFNSCNAVCHKRSVARTLASQAWTISLSKDAAIKEVTRAQCILSTNDYSKQFFTWTQRNLV